MSSDVRRALIKRQKNQENIFYSNNFTSNVIIQVHWKGCNHQCVLTNVSIAIFLHKLDLEVKEF